MSSKDNVLIIEDSPAIGMLLKNYLEKLGYTQIHTCTNGSTAIKTFKELVTLEKHPIVLLDYMLPDMDARSILTQILEVQPNARVVLETATEKDDEGIKELIRLGIYQYLEKPIRFENLKSVFETIEKEQSFFEKESEQVKDLIKYFDWALTEDCFVDEFCSEFEPFIKNGKAVFQAEYTDTDVTTDEFCPQSKTLQFSGILKDRELDAAFTSCS